MIPHRLHTWLPTLTRLEERDNPSGGLDLSFDTDGRQTTSFSTTDSGSAVVVQPDGKILVAGTSFIGSGPDFSVARYNPDGTLDTTFDGDGRATNIFGADDFCTSMALQADGRIVLAGYTNVGGTNDFAVMRLTATGALDNSFDTDGRQTIDFTGDDRASGVVIQTNGRIVVAGSWDAGASDFAVARLTDTGALDNSFDTDGRFTFSVGGTEFCTGVALQSDGRIVMVGYTTFGNAAGNPNNFVAARVTTGGTLDTSFDTDGMLTADFGSDDRASAVAIQSDGKILVAGSYSIGTSANFAFVRLIAANGSFDTTFDFDGRADYTFGAEDICTSVAIQGDGKIVAAGYTNNFTTNDFGVMRLTTAGALDTSFDADGRQTVDFSNDDRANGVALQADGRIVLAGATSPAGSGDFAVARLIGRDTDLIGRESSGNWWLNHTTGSSFTVSTATFWVEGGAWRDVRSGDVNGDGLSDLIGRTSDGHWWVSRNNGDGTFNYMHFAAWNEAAGWKDVNVGDFNADGRTDVAGRTSDGHWWVGLSNGSAFVTTHWAMWNEAAGWKDVRYADYTGDGRTDIAGRTSDGHWWVAVSTGAAFNTAHWAAWNEAAGWKDVGYADFNGDGRYDLAGRTSDGHWWVALSNGTSAFVTTHWVGWNEAADWRDVRFADFNGDGRADIAGRTASGHWWVAVSTGTTFSSTTVWAAWNESAGWKDVIVGDFSGDGRPDIAARTSDGHWWVAVSTGTAFNTTHWTSWNESAGWKAVLLGSYVG